MDIQEKQREITGILPDLIRNISSILKNVSWDFGIWGLKQIWLLCILMIAGDLLRWRKNRMLYIGNMCWPDFLRIAICGGLWQMNMTYLTTRQWRIGKVMQKLFVKKTHIIICVLFITVLYFMTTIVHGLLIVVFRDRIYTNLQNW